MAFVIMLIIAVALAVRLNRSIEDTLGLSIFGIITILYVSGLITVFDPGLYIVYLICGISAIYIIIILIRNKHLKVFNVNFFIYFLVAVYFLFVSYGRFFNQIDDFIHWAIATKYYYIYSDFSNASFTSDWAWKYPPFATLWAYFFTKNWVSCSSGMMLWGQQIFILSLLAPVLKLIQGKQKTIRIVSVVLFIMTLPYWVHPIGSFGSYLTLMPDILIGVLFFYILWNYREYCRTSDRFYLFLSLYGCFAITLVKTTGIIHVLLVVYTILTYNIKTNTSYKTSIKQLVLYIFASMIAYISWNAYTIAAGGSIVTSMLYSFGILVNKKSITVFVALLLLGVGIILVPTSRKIVIRLYNNYRRYIPESLFILFMLSMILLAVGYDYGDRELVYYINAFVEFWLDITIAHAGYLIRIPIALFCILMSIIVSVIIKNENDQIIWKSAVACFVMYSLFRCVGRMIVTPDENPVSSLGRYMYSGLVAVIIIGFCMTLEYLKINQRDILITTIILVFTNSSTVLSAVFDKTKPVEFPALEGVNFDVSDKLFLVDTFIDDDRCELQFMYEATPALYSGNAYEATWYKDNDLSGRRLTLDEVNSKLIEKDIDYVYLRNVDEGFEDYYADLFVDNISTNHLYKVIRDGDMLHLEFYN